MRPNSNKTQDKKVQIQIFPFTKKHIKYAQMKHLHPSTTVITHPELQDDLWHFPPVCGSTLGKAATVRQRDGTHPPAAKRQALRDDVNAKNLEDLLRRQLLLGHILGVGQVERLVPWRAVRALFPADGGGHLSTSAARGKTRDGAMPQHCRAALLLHHIQEAQVNVRRPVSRAAIVFLVFRGALLAEPPSPTYPWVTSLLSITL